MSDNNHIVTKEEFEKYLNELALFKSKMYPKEPSDSQLLEFIDAYLAKNNNGVTRFWLNEGATKYTNSVLEDALNGKVFKTIPNNDN